MTFRVLSELLELNEAPSLAGVKGIVSDIKAGYQDAKQRYERATEKAEKAKATAEKKLNKEQLDAVKALTENFIDEFFDSFPNFGSERGPEHIKRHIHTRDQALAAFTTFKKLGDELEKLLNAMNSSLKGSKKMDGKLDKYIADGKRFAETEPPAELIRFVQAESSFFKRLIRIDDKFEIDKADFKDLLKRKMDRTDASRFPDAAHALNILLAYMVAEIRGYARQIAVMGRKLPVPETDK